MNIEENKMGGDFIMPTASDEAKRAILTSRAMLYAGPEGKEGQAINQAIDGSNRLADGAAAVIAMVIGGVEQKIGELSDKDLQVTVAHLAGTIVEIAREKGDPDALNEDGASAVREITAKAMDMLTGGGQPEQESPSSPMQMQPQPLMRGIGDQNGQ